MIYTIAAYLLIAAVCAGLIWGAYLLSRWLKHKAPQSIRDAATSLVMLLLIVGACLSFKGVGCFGVIAKALFWLVVAFYVADVFTRYAQTWKRKWLTLTHKEKGESRS